MTQQAQQPMYLLDNDPSNVEEWTNDTDDDFIVRCHMQHGEGVDKKTQPTFITLRFPAHSTVAAPKMARRAIHQYQCAEPECRSKGNKLCYEDHDSQKIIGGHAPMLKRKAKPNIPLADALNTRLVEVTGRNQQTGAIERKLEPKMEDRPVMPKTVPGRKGD